MSGGERDPVTELATEIAKQLAKEAYRDVFSPAAKQAGAFVEEVVKTLRLVLFPLQFGSAYQDRLTNFLNKSIRRVPEERRTAPPPQVLGPVVEGIRYEPEGTPIDEMFSELLSKAFDRHEVTKAHPSFALIIRQLSADEAALLREMWLRREKPLRRQSVQRMRRVSLDTSQDIGLTMEVDEVREVLSYPDNANLYLDHLYALGLQQQRINGQDEMFAIGESRTDFGLRTAEVAALTPWGLRFMEAVSPRGRTESHAPLD